MFDFRKYNVFQDVTVTAKCSEKEADDAVRALDGLYGEEGWFELYDEKDDGSIVIRGTLFGNRYCEEDGLWEDDYEFVIDEYDVQNVMEDLDVPCDVKLGYIEANSMCYGGVM